jgi:hypothetical protein
MARINVEQKALTDHRFQACGRLLGCDRHAALGICVHVWNACQEEGTYHLTRDALSDLHPHLPQGALHDALIGAGLARVEPEGVYICGTRGRIEWLTRKREAARENGAKGGRPRAGTDVGTNGGTDEETDIGSTVNRDRFPAETAPAPAPSSCLPAPDPDHQEDAPASLRLIQDPEATGQKKGRKTKTPPRPVDRTSDAYRLASLFLELLRQYDEHAKADLSTWALQLAPLIGERGAVEVEEVIRHALRSAREARFTRSPESLKKHITPLVIALREAKGGRRVAGGTGTTDEHAYFTKRGFDR